ncbi:UNVERIFIED_CONTAM: hypothetical protein RMT77_002376 [Armadillidium vulgare]
MDDILKYERKEEDDYYFILGCDKHSTTEQIQAEFRNLAPQFHPDKNPDDPEAEKKFQLIQTARDVLCDPKKRANYDKWRESGLAIPFDQWSNAAASMTTTLHWATPQTKDRMLEPCSSDDPEGSAKRQQRRSSDFASVGRAAEGWESDRSEVLRKFRNYEI